MKGSSHRETPQFPKFYATDEMLVYNDDFRLVFIRGGSSPERFAARPSEALRDLGVMCYALFLWFYVIK